MRLKAKHSMRLSITPPKVIMKTRTFGILVEGPMGLQMPEETARLHQLEILKLRMEIREILDSHRALVLDAEDSSRVESTSHTMASERATSHC